MARAFLPHGDLFVARLDPAERAILVGLMEQTRQVLAPEREPTGDALDDVVASLGFSLTGESLDDGSAEDDERDPALDRLLPTAHRGDDEVAAEFRRLTEEGLRQRKSGNLDLALASVAAADGDEVRLDHRQAPAFLMALTDVRLLLGERLGMRTEADAEELYEALEEIEDDDPVGYAMAVYDFLTWLQESLTIALMGERDEE